MTRDEIIGMACGQGLPETSAEGVFIVNTDDLGRMLAAEREACARIADEWATREQKEFGNGGPGAAIRARGEK